MKNRQAKSVFVIAMVTVVGLLATMSVASAKEGHYYNDRDSVEQCEYEKSAYWWSWFFRNRDCGSVEEPVKEPAPIKEPVKEPIKKVDPANIGDRIWNDKDADGVQERGEGGLNGVTVELINRAGEVEATMVTSGNGNYMFRDIDPGSYTVRIVTSSLPAGFEATYELDGSLDGETSWTLRSGQTRKHVDFGYKALPEPTPVPPTPTPVPPTPTPAPIIGD